MRVIPMRNSSDCNLSGSVLANFPKCLWKLYGINRPAIDLQ